MATKAQSLAKGKRIYWMDNLRTIIIFLVVLYHVGGVYESAGLWKSFWIVSDSDTLSWVGIVGIAFDIFIMPTMFFISGYLTPPSLKNKTTWGFLKRKFRRLIVPWAVAVLTLIPLYKVIFLYSRGLPQEAWTTYFHFSEGNISSQNWLWFLPLLFVFNLLYLLLQKANINVSSISRKWAVLVVFLISFAYSFGIGWVVEFRSWTHSALLDFENERVLIYFLTFLLGVLFFEQNAFAEKPKSKLVYNIANGVAWIPVTGHIFVRIYPFFFPEGFAVTPLYRLLWWLSFDLALVSMMVVMIESFWRYFDKTGRIWAELNRNSYGVYIIHVALIGIFGTLLLHTNLPALAKYPLLLVSTYVGSNLLVSAYRSLTRSLRPRGKEPIIRPVDAR
ncbi:MAG: acyltransferase [Ardenticatenaceae bacterium]|nr:acyltransferase [Ardenticatenaceae bacterium]